MQFEELSPVTNGKGKMRTVVRVRLDEKQNYTIIIGDENYRYFTEENVPDEVKALIAMINAFPKKERDVNFFSSSYTCPDPRLEDIGWEIEFILPFQRVYMLVLSAETFNQILGV